MSSEHSDNMIAYLGQWTIFIWLNMLLLLHIGVVSASGVPPWCAGE
jgi:hypothetical protein